MGRKSGTDARSGSARITSVRRDRRQLVFHFVNGLHECMSVSFAANLSFAEWSSAFNDRKMTAAPLD